MQGCRNDATGMLKSSRERKRDGNPSQEQRSPCEAVQHRGNELPEGLRAPSKDLSPGSCSSTAYPEVPAGPFWGLQLTGLSALLDWACWGIKPLPPASQEGLRTARILKDHWSITHSVNK